MTGTAPEEDERLLHFLSGKSEHTLALFHYFIAEYQKLGSIIVQPTKTIIGISSARRRIAWVTQLGKNFIHIVFPLKQPYQDNLCFTKVAQVPGSASQFNHHFRMLHLEDINEEVRNYMLLAYEQ